MVRAGNFEKCLSGSAGQAVKKCAHPAKGSMRFDVWAQRSASSECVRLIRKLRWIGMDDGAEQVSAQLSGWPFPTETIAGPWATDVTLRSRRPRRLHCSLLWRNKYSLTAFIVYEEETLFW
jgi:hypothetical protein